MNPEHLALRDALHALAGTGSAAHHGSRAYMGSPDRLLGVTTPDLRRLAKGWLASSPDLRPEAVLAVVDAMFASPVHEEKTLAALIVGYSAPCRRSVTPSRVDEWLDRLAGWAQVDALCSNVFQAEDLLGDWSAWGSWLRRLACESNVNKRRAALVLLTGPVRRHDDPRLLEASLDNLRRLQNERAVLITKAVSWLLRNLSIRHRDAAARYLEENRATLPAIAVREAAAKLEIGRKTRTRRD